VIVTRLDAEQRRIALRLKNVVGRPAQPGLVPILVSPGRRGTGRVVKAVSEADGRGGYVLVRLADGTRPALLLARDMTADLRLDLNNGHVEIGERSTSGCRAWTTAATGCCCGNSPRPTTRPGTTSRAGPRSWPPPDSAVA
jgi:hypothetical protein